MSAVKDQLKRVNKRVKELEANPSELAKDALLADLRTFYDVTKEVEVATKKPVAPKPVAKGDLPIESTPEPVAEKVVEPVKETVAEKAPEPIVDKQVQKAKSKPAKEPMIAEKQVEEFDNDEKILAGQFNKSPLSDLRSGIPLNEKFGIIRNLFKGNASDFGDAVLKLNNASNAKEMTHYMELLKQRFGWDEEVEAYKNFVGYVDRKMMTLKPSNANSD